MLLSSSSFPENRLFNLAVKHTITQSQSGISTKAACYPTDIIPSSSSIQFRDSSIQNAAVLRNRMTLIQPFQILALITNSMRATGSLFPNKCLPHWIYFRINHISRTHSRSYTRPNVCRNATSDLCILPNSPSQTNHGGRNIQTTPPTIEFLPDKLG